MSRSGALLAVWAEERPPGVRMAKLVLTVNGAKRRVAAPPDESLLSVLRNLAGAIFAATGVRLRALPLVPEGLPAGARESPVPSAR